MPKPFASVFPEVSETYVIYLKLLNMVVREMVFVGTQFPLVRSSSKAGELSTDDANNTIINHHSNSLLWVEWIIKNCYCT